MTRLTINQNASAEYSQQKGVEYIVLQINDKKVIEDAQIKQMGQELYDCVDSYSHANFCLDFGNVDFCSSAFLSKLIHADKKLRSRRGGRVLGLRNIRPEVYGLFEITKLDRLFDIDEVSKRAYEESQKRRDEGVLSP